MGVPAPAESDDLVALTVVLPRPVPDGLSVGAFLKNSLCITRGAQALVTRDAGNLDTVEAVRAFEDMAEALLAETGFRPTYVAHDLHPDFHSTRYAEALAADRGIETVPVQHHHAHVAAVMAEHGSERPVLGLALDGFGLGEDGGSWGGELLRVDAEGFERLGHMALLKQPGGDAAARQPWRMAAAALHAMGRGAEITDRFAGQQGAGVIAAMLDKDVNCPTTSSCGRLFDAACGLLGVKPVAQFEGEAPMALEAMANAPEADPGGWTIDDGVLDTTPLLDRLTALDAKAGANLFHGTIAAALADWVAGAAEATGIREVALCGGCFLNRVMTTALCERLDGMGLRPIQPVNLGPGDVAISLGQAWAAAMARG